MRPSREECRPHVRRQAPSAAHTHDALHLQPVTPTPVVHHESYLGVLCQTLQCPWPGIWKGEPATAPLAWQYGCANAHMHEWQRLQLCMCMSCVFD